MVVQGIGSARFFLQEPIIFHEKQGNNRLCGQHVINNILQKPAIDSYDLKTAVGQIDSNEAMVRGQNPDTQFKSENASNDGYFNVPVIEFVLMKHKMGFSVLTNKQTTVFNDPQSTAEAFLIHKGDHWFCLRKIRSSWFIIDSLKSSPERLPGPKVNAKVKELLMIGTVFYVYKIDGTTMPIADDWVTEVNVAKRSLASHQTLSSFKACKSSTSSVSVPVSDSSASTATNQGYRAPPSGYTSPIRGGSTRDPFSMTEDEQIAWAIEQSMKSDGPAKNVRSSITSPDRQFNDSRVNPLPFSPSSSSLRPPPPAPYPTSAPSAPISPEPESGGITIAIRAAAVGQVPKRHLRKFDPEANSSVFVSWIRSLIPIGDLKLASSAPPPKRFIIKGAKVYHGDEELTEKSIRLSLLSVSSSTGESFNLTQSE